MADPAPFTRFSRDALGFLVELTENNDRAWFKDNQPRYEAAVREPTRAFVRAMAPRLRRISKHLVANDAKVGGSMMRPHRDTRFSPDKAPYKTNVGVQFRHAAGKDVHAPGLYVHFDPAEVFIGVGLWHPEPEALGAIRQRIIDKPALWKRVRDDARLRRHFELGGDSLKRPPRGIAADHPLVEDLRRKDHIAIARLQPGDLFKPRFLDLVDERFAASRGYMKFLCDALDLPF